MTESQNAARDVQGGGDVQTVNQSQDAVIEAIRDWADAVQALTPKLPPLNVPFAGKLPQPEQLVASAYDFAEQVARQQAQVAEELVKATSPLLPIKEEGSAGEKGGAKVRKVRTAPERVAAQTGRRRAGRSGPPPLYACSIWRNISAHRRD